MLLSFLMGSELSESFASFRFEESETAIANTLKWFKSRMDSS
jgi:hypothetical protein